MTIREIELIHDSKRSKMIGNMHEDDLARIEARQAEAEANGDKLL